MRNFLQSKITGARANAQCSSFRTCKSAGKMNFDCRAQKCTRISPDSVRASISQAWAGNWCTAVLDVFYQFSFIYFVQLQIPDKLLYTGHAVGEPHRRSRSAWETKAVRYASCAQQCSVQMQGPTAWQANVARDVNILLMLNTAAPRKYDREMLLC